MAREVRMSTALVICTACPKPHTIPATVARDGRCPAAARARRRERQARPIERIYDSARWRTITRPAVLDRDGHACVYCGSTSWLRVAHLGETQKMLELGVDVYDPALAVT